VTDLQAVCHGRCYATVDTASPVVTGSAAGHVMSSDRKSASYQQQQHAGGTSSPTASRPQTLSGPAGHTGRDALLPVSLTSGTCFGGGRTFPRRAAGAAATLQPAGRRRIGDASPGRPASRAAAAPSGSSRSFSDLTDGGLLSPPPPPPPPPVDPEPRGRAPTLPRGGPPPAAPRRGDSWTLDRHHRSLVSRADNPPADVTAAPPRACVVDCRLTGYPVCDV